jgi:hypothetical protein
MRQGCIKLLRSIRQGWIPLSFSKTNPAGLAAGYRWSARVKRADHRVNVSEILHPERVPAPLPANLRLTLDKGWS